MGARVKAWLCPRGYLENGVLRRGSVEAVLSDLILGIVLIPQLLEREDRGFTITKRDCQMGFREAF